MFPDLQRVYPDRINNKTNGITPRRWLIECNPGLTALHRATRSATRCLDDAEALEAASPRIADDPAFQERFAAVQARQQGALAALIARPARASRVDPDAMFDVQIKRIHEYKRQLLNILETIALYNAIRAQPDAATGCRA